MTKTRAGWARRAAMLATFDGKRIKGNGFKSLAAVKAQFKKAGHEPGRAADLQTWQEDGERGLFCQWQCSCGAKLRFIKQGRTFNRLTVIGG